MTVQVTDQFGATHTLTEPLHLFHSTIHGLCLHGVVDGEEAAFQLSKCEVWEPLPDLGQAEMAVAA